MIRGGRSNVSPGTLTLVLISSVTLDNLLNFSELQLLDLTGLF